MLVSICPNRYNELNKSICLNIYIYICPGKPGDGSFEKGKAIKKRESL